jgi:hypothetical protein
MSSSSGEAMSKRRADAYRTSEPIPIEPVALEPRGLVRANGTACTCTPPGFLWRWWFSVQLGDTWRCTHGGAWEWRYAVLPFSSGYKVFHWALIDAK